MDPVLEFAMAVKAADREIQRRMNDLLRPHGITAAQAEAVTVIGQAEPVSLKELGQLLIAEAGHPSRLVDRLVDAGLVQRRGATEDRRRIELGLTPRGRDLLEHIAAAQQAMLEWGRGALAGRDLRAAIDAVDVLLADSPLGVTLALRRAGPDCFGPPLC